MRKIQDRGILRVAINPDSYGFCARNPTTGSLEGIDVMIARRFAQAIFGGTMREVRPNIDFVESLMVERMDRLRQNDIDIVVAALAATPERRKIADFTIGYYGTALTVAVRKDSGITSVVDLQRARAVIVEGSADLEYAIGNDVVGSMIRARSNSEMFKMFAAGKADAVMCGAVHLDAYCEYWSDLAVRLPVEFESYQYAVGLRKGDEEFCEFLNLQIADVLRNGYAAIASQFNRRRLNL